MPDSLDDVEMDLGRLPDIRNNDQQTPSPAQQVRRALRGKHVCPFCGTTRETDLGACLQCSLEDTPTTRSATRTKLGPWYVLQSRNPSAPGMNFATLMVLVQKGRVTARSVLRGPTTGQFWRHAAKVKGVSREFGLCWNCGSDVARNARACASCKRLQEPPLNPDILLESGEMCSEELAEAMWSDHTPPSSQMPGSRPHPTTPIERSPIDRSSVDRIAARGGIRREVPVPRDLGIGAPAAAEVNVGSLPPRPSRGILSEDAEELPHNGLDMAVFQMPPRSEAYPTDRPGGGGGASFKVLKGMFISFLILVAGVVALAAFDPGFKNNCALRWEKAKAWWSNSGSQPAGLQIDPAPERPAPAANQQFPTKPVISDVKVEAPRTAVPPVTGPDQPKLRVWELWKAATEAKNRGDFTLALKTYEAIKALPVQEEDWPLGLQAQIDNAKKRLNIK